jgi:DNA-binding NtrC family response regulator
MTLMTTFPSMTRVAGGALIASASSAFRDQVLHNLNGRCRPVQQALGGAEALVKLEKGDWQVLFLDRRVPDLDTDELIAIIQRRFPRTQVVLLDSDADAASANSAPSFLVETTSSLGSVAQDSTLEENPQTIERFPEFEPLPGMIGRSESMRRVYRMARLVAPRTTTVLIAGPTGSGKELVARALHSLSPRAAKPFVAVNCAAIPEALVESELFGYSRGAFTGAVQSQLGRIPAAHGGTLFLDEVSELPLGMQAKLLRFLEQKEVQRLGDYREQRGSRGPGRQTRIPRRSFLPPLGVSAGAAAADRAPRRYHSTGRTLSRAYGGRNE